MRKSSRLSYQDFAKFLIENSNNPTEGLVVDALRAEGASDEEVDSVLSEIRHFFDNMQIDINDPEIGLSEFDEPIDAEGETLQDMVDSGDPGFMGSDPMIEPPSSTFDDTEPELEEVSAEDYAPEEQQELVDEFLLENPDASEEEIQAYLVEVLGMPKEDALLKSSNVSYIDAAKWILKGNPEIDTETIRSKLELAGASPREVEDVISQLPTRQEQQSPIGGPEEMGPGGPEEGLEGPEEPAKDWFSIAEDYKKNNPSLTPEDLMSILEGEGASPEEIESVVNSLENQYEEGQTVAGYKIAAVYPSEVGETVYKLSNDEVLYHNELVARVEADFENAQKDTILNRVEAHLSENWYSDYDELPVASKSQSEQRLASTRRIREEIAANILSQKVADQQRLAELDEVLAHEEEYLEDELKTAYTLDDADYVKSKPQFEIKASEQNIELGSADGVFYAAAIEAQREVESIDWKNEVTAGADIFVEKIATSLIGDTGEVRKLATRHIKAKTSHLAKEDSETITKLFLENVEKSRRVAAKEARETLKNAKVKEAASLPDNFEEGLFS